MILYSYFQSSASYRVRIALNHKEIPYEYRAVHLVREGGEQHKADYKNLNPLGEVPTLVHGQKILAQSMAIFFYLDQTYPEKILFSKDAYEAARILQFCEVVNSGMQPVVNLRVRQELETRFGADAKARESWCAYFNERGLSTLEKILEKTSGRFCFGDQVSAADMFLIPQLFNARRNKVDLSKYKCILKVETECVKQEAFIKAQPKNQPDFEA